MIRNDGYCRETTTMLYYLREVWKVWYQWIGTATLNNRAPDRGDGLTLHLPPRTALTVFLQLLVSN